MDKLEEIKLRDAEHQGLTLIVHEDRRWLLGEIEQLTRARQAIDLDYETMSQEEVDRQLREAGYDPRLVGKYYQLLADYTVLQAEVDRMRVALEAAESQIHYLKKELVARHAISGDW